MCDKILHTRITKGDDTMKFDIQKTENDYQISITDNTKKIILSENEFLQLQQAYQKEVNLQELIIKECEYTGKYRPEKLTEIPLWDKISDYLDDQLQNKQKTPQMAVTNTYKKFCIEFYKYRIKTGEII